MEQVDAGVNGPTGSNQNGEARRLSRINPVERTQIMSSEQKRS